MARRGVSAAKIQAADLESKRKPASGLGDELRVLVPDGQVRIEPQRGGRFLVEIGRARYTKRFNLSTAEARILVDELSAVLDRAGGLRDAPGTGKIGG